MEYEDEIERMKMRNRRRGTIPSALPNEEEDDTINLDFSEKLVKQRDLDADSKALKRARLVKNKRKKRRILLIELIILIGLIFVAFQFFKKHSESGYWTIAIFGVDSRDGNLGKGSLSDVEMICNINKETGEIQLVSVFRDTYMQINKDGTYHKINEAYFKGGSSQAIEALNTNLDLDIRDYATFNWKAVADTINILGGIDLEITEKEFKYINSFITETVESTNIGSVHLTSPGMNHLDGVQAVAYARLRLMDTDYNRTERQRKVVSLAMEKAKQADFSVLNNILVTVLPQVSTSIGIDDLIPMAMNIKKYHLGVTGGFPYSRGEALVGKKDCVIPMTLESNVIQLHAFLYGIEHYTPSATVKKISAKIASDSGLGEVKPNAPTGGNGSGQTAAPTEAITVETLPQEESSEAATEESTEESSEISTEETTESIPEVESNQPTQEEIGPGVTQDAPTTQPTATTSESNDVQVKPEIKPSGASPDQTASETSAAEEIIGPGV